MFLKIYEVLKYAFRFVFRQGEVRRSKTRQILQASEQEETKTKP